MNDHQEPVLVCKDLCISYYTRAGEIPAVVDFSLTVLPGETIGIVGESGCGKSTVAMAIMQYMGANGGIKSGSIEFKGRDMTQMSPEELRRLRGSEIAMIYQELNLAPDLSVEDNLTLGAYGQRKDRQWIEEELRWVYELFPILEEGQLPCVFAAKMRLSFFCMDHVGRLYCKRESFYI